MRQRKTAPHVFSITATSFRILREYIREWGLKNGDYSGALNNILKDWYAMRLVARTRKPYRSVLPDEPMTSLQDEIMRIKSHLRGYKPTQEERLKGLPKAEWPRKHEK